MSPTSSTYSRSVSSNDSDTEGTAVNAWKKRIQKLQQSADVTVEPCDVLLNNALVTITNVVSHKIVFLRSIEAKDDDRYWKYLNDVVESSKTAMPLDEKPKKGDLVLAKFEGAYYRALVARIENDVAVVAFLEFGNLERKPISELLKLREDLKYVKRFTFKANLSDVNGGLKTDKCLTYLYHLLERVSPLKFIKKGKAISSKGIRCELVVSATNESVNAKLDSLNQIQPDKAVLENVISRFSYLVSYFHDDFITGHSNQTIGCSIYSDGSRCNRQYVHRKGLGYHCNEGKYESICADASTNSGVLRVPIRVPIYTTVSCSGDALWR